MSIVNKETNPFKFNNYNWKLLAKMLRVQNPDDNQFRNVLKIYFKIESIKDENEEKIDIQSNSY